MYRRSVSLVALFLLIILPADAQKRAMTWEDMMHFRRAAEVQISENGSMVALSAIPDRGDSEVLIVPTNGGTEYTIPLGRAPQITPDGRFVAARIDPPFAEAERASKRDEPEPGMALLDTSTGTVVEYQEIDRFAFSPDGRWLAFLRASDADTSAADSTNNNGDRKGAPLTLRNLADGAEHHTAGVGTFEWASTSPRLAFTLSGDSLTTALRVADLTAEQPTYADIHAAPGHEYAHLTWTGRHADVERMAFAARPELEEDAGDEPAQAYLWTDGELRRVAIEEQIPNEWTLPLRGSIIFSGDGERLFVGTRPRHEDDDAPADTTDAALFDVDAILHEATVDVWHVDDARIKTQERQTRGRERSATFPIVYHIDDGAGLLVGGPDRRPTSTPDNPRSILTTNPTPYLPLITWEGSFADVYAIDLRTGEERLIAERLESRPQLSPDGRHVVYYESEHWHAVDLDTGSARNLTRQMPVDFSNEDHDFPRPAPGYGTGGWVGNDAVLIYDKFDVWQVQLSGEGAIRITNGRPENRIFRVIRTDQQQEYFAAGEEILLSMYHDRNKNYGFYRAIIGREGAERLMEDDARFDFITKADDAATMLFTRERFDEFPDIWVSDLSLHSPRRLTDVNPQMADFRWGSAELIDYHNIDGVPMQGVVMKPDNYDPARSYPVIVYFYRFFSQRLHEFNRPQINHRPAFPFYTGRDYVVFLPDVVFEVGRPGYSATKSLVPAVQKLIDVGIADPDRIALHGHSWSGYQTAFAITQTNIFRTAIAGAPVSNMTSAYSGIRWGTGMARQFQYEMQQSRIGRSMWEARDLYIENSPVFYADRIHTPLLIIHGDEDGAVPWEQSIEMYLAMRRLGKEAVFLHYHGEDHHPASYPNKLDWAMRMKEWFDYYLKDVPVAWIEEGEEPSYRD